MKTKNIFKTVALAMLMPAMLLTTACSSDDDLVNNENTATKGYALPVTVNVTREGDKGSNRATYTESTGKLAFSTGDKLFVKANYSSLAGPFAGLLDYDTEQGNFSGTIYTEGQYTGTAEALLADASALMATLVPAGYDTYGYLSINNAGAYNANLLVALNKVFALTKNEAVEQLSFESVDEYDNGFALVPRNAVVCFSISGLAADTEVEVIFKEKSDDPVPPVNVTTDASGVATFAVGMPGIENFDNFSLTVDGFAIALPENKNVVAGKIYNMSRPVPGVKWNSTDMSSIVLSAGSIEIRGITLACDDLAGFTGSTLYSQSGNISFTSSKGNIKKIEINHSGYSMWSGAEGFDGWPSDYEAEGGTFTWEGTPTDKVELPETDGWGQIDGITSIVFTLE